jgi:hypothetical protein
MKYKKIVSLKEAAEILKIPVKTIYSRINSKKFKNCFIKKKKKRNGENYIYYKYSCVKKELKEKVTEEDSILYIQKYYQIIELLKEKYNLKSTSKAEKKLRKLIKENIHKFPYLSEHTNKRIYQITDCNIKNKKFLLNVINFFESLEKKLKNSSAFSET